MNISAVVILSIIEGLTEFLPISSTGHLILAAKILNIPNTSFVKSFEIFIQLGAILAVLYIYSLTIWKKRSIGPKIAAAFFPTALVGLVFYREIKDVLLGNSLITVTALFIGGILLMFTEKLRTDKTQPIKNLEQISFRQAFTIGVFQSLSVIPGMSRAGATIIGGMILGLSRKTAVEFSFILAIPTMMAAAGLDLYKESFRFSRQESIYLLTGIIISFLTAITGIKFLLRFIQKNSFTYFGIYRIIIALLFFYFFIS